MLSTMQDVPLNVSQILRHGSVVHAGSRVITWTASGPRERRFAEVGARATRLAHGLRELGVRGDERVATLMWNNAEHLEAYLAVPSMGAVLHTLNLRLPADQLAYIVNHADDRVIIVDASLLPVLEPLLPGVPGVEHVVVVGGGELGPVRPAVHDYEELIAGRPDEFGWPELDERTAAAMCYTSGTTGDPKGVVYSHRSVYLHAMQVNMARVLGSGPEDTALPVVPMFHVNAWGVPHSSFLAGVNLLLPDRFAQPGPLAEMIATVRPTHAAGVPTVWQGLLAAGSGDLSSLRSLVIGGSACPPALIRAYDALGVRVNHAWGMTEMSPLGTVAEPPPGLPPEQEYGYRVTQGRFRAGVQARLAGPDGEILPWDGQSVGELEVRGPWIAAAYYGGTAAEPLRPADRFAPDGWLRTGDVGTITPDGYLTLTDRAKDVIKSGGEWISSMALENLLMDHPAVVEAAVVAVPDDKWGERPLAAVVVAEGAEVTFEELRLFLAERIPRWQLPERWTRVEAVPKTSVGKFDKKVLRRWYADDKLPVTHL
ncbi:long-chain fatty acid--CoA ligase [Nonomuraea sediminis]|uniref:long-chain fatty acid--CoA ligase n=1 Tax=Nonomuraea sediminis TaxID=2835864 RepID=UPI001BDBE300|nr:long-chain fatty acid--CoA ligase [Nonomuraea sediminis]